MKLAYLQLKQEMDDLDCTNGNISKLPWRFSPWRKSPEEECGTEYLQINNFSHSNKKNSLSIERVSTPSFSSEADTYFSNIMKITERS